MVRLKVIMTFPDKFRPSGYVRVCQSNQSKNVYRKLLKKEYYYFNNYNMRTGNVSTYLYNLGSWKTQVHICCNKVRHNLLCIDTSHIGYGCILLPWNQSYHIHNLKTKSMKYSSVSNSSGGGLIIGGEWSRGKLFKCVWGGG